MTFEEEVASVERWRLRILSDLGFDSNGCALLNAWNVDLHEVERLMRRGGEATGCTQEQAIRILAPDEYLAIA